MIATRPSSWSRRSCGRRAGNPVACPAYASPIVGGAALYALGRALHPSRVLASIALGGMDARRARGEEREESEPRLFLPGATSSAPGSGSTCAGPKADEIAGARDPASVDGGKHYTIWVSPRLDPDRCRYLWRVPAVGNAALSIRIRFNRGGRRSRRADAAPARARRGTEPEPLALLPLGGGDAERAPQARRSWRAPQAIEASARLEATDDASYSHHASVKAIHRVTPVTPHRSAGNTLHTTLTTPPVRAAASMIDAPTLPFLTSEIPPWAARLRPSARAHAGRAAPPRMREVSSCCARYDRACYLRLCWLRRPLHTLRSPWIRRRTRCWSSIRRSSSPPRAHHATNSTFRTATSVVTARRSQAARHAYPRRGAAGRRRHRHRRGLRQRLAHPQRRMWGLKEFDALLFTLNGMPVGGPFNPSSPRSRSRTSIASRS